MKKIGCLMMLFCGLGLASMLSSEIASAEPSLQPRMSDVSSENGDVLKQRKEEGEGKPAYPSNGEEWEERIKPKPILPLGPADEPIRPWMKPPKPKPKPPKGPDDGPVIFRDADR